METNDTLSEDDDESEHKTLLVPHEKSGEKAKRKIAVDRLSENSGSAVDRLSENESSEYESSENENLRGGVLPKSVKSAK